MSERRMRDEATTWSSERQAMNENERATHANKQTATEGRAKNERRDDDLLLRDTVMVLASNMDNIRIWKSMRCKQRKGMYSSCTYFCRCVAYACDVSVLVDSLKSNLEVTNFKACFKIIWNQSKIYVLGKPWSETLQWRTSRLVPKYLKYKSKPRFRANLEMKPWSGNLQGLSSQPIR